MSLRSYLQTRLMNGIDFANKKIAAVGYQIGLSRHAHNTEPSKGWRHSDDILFAGEEKFVDDSQEASDIVFCLKATKKHCTILNRLINFIASGEKSGTYHDGTELEISKVTLYRSFVMCSAFFQYRSSAFAVLLARGTSKPATEGIGTVRKVLRVNLITHGRWLQEYRRQEPMSLIDIVTDSGWVSDKNDRRSVSCAVTRIGEHCITMPNYQHQLCLQVKPKRGYCQRCQYRNWHAINGMRLWRRTSCENCNRQQCVEGHDVKTCFGQNPSSRQRSAVVTTSFATQSAAPSLDAWTRNPADIGNNDLAEKTKNKS